MYGLRLPLCFVFGQGDNQTQPRYGDTDEPEFCYGLHTRFKEF